MRLLLSVVDAVRLVWPANLPLFVRISATDWTEGGLTIEQSVEVAHALKAHGVDLIDVSSGGNVAKAVAPATPGYQVSFAERIRREAGIATGAIGLITDPHQATAIISNQQAELVFMGRELLCDPYWPLHAALRLSLASTISAGKNCNFSCPCFVSFHSHSPGECSSFTPGRTPDKKTRERHTVSLVFYA